MPERCPLIKERRRLRYRYRQLLYASHRVIFRIDADRAIVTRIYHTARRALRPVDSGE